MGPGVPLRRRTFYTTRRPVTQLLPETRDPRRAGRPRPFSGGVSLAFMLLVLMGVGGVAVLDPALGVWSVVASGRAEGERAHRAVVAQSRLIGVRDAHAERRLADRSASPVSGTRSDSHAPQRRADDARALAKSGLGDLPPPSRC